MKLFYYSCHDTNFEDNGHIGLDYLIHWSMNMRMILSVL